MEIKHTYISTIYTWSCRSLKNHTALFVHLQIIHLADLIIADLYVIYRQKEFNANISFVQYTTHQCIIIAIWKADDVLQCLLGLRYWSICPLKQHVQYHVIKYTITVEILTVLRNKISSCSEPPPSPSSAILDVDLCYLYFDSNPITYQLTQISSR